LYLAGNARERDPNPKRLRRAREPEDPTNVEGPITDVGIGRPTRVARGVRGSSRYKTTIRRRTDRGGRNNSRKARGPLGAAEVSSPLILLRVSPVGGIAARRPMTFIVALAMGGARLSGSVKFPRQIEGPGTRENYE